MTGFEWHLFTVNSQTPNLYLSHSGFVPQNVIWVCECVCMCVCVCDCVTGGRPVGGKMQEVCLSVSTCIRRSMFFPFRGEVSCVRPHVCVSVCVCRRSHWAADFQEPLQQKQALCVSCTVITGHTTHTHTHTHTDHCPILFSLAGFLNAYPCASGRQDVSLWLPWENLLSGNKPEDTNRRRVTASSQPRWFLRTRKRLFTLSWHITSAPLMSDSEATYFLRHQFTTIFPFSLISLWTTSNFLIIYFHPIFSPSSSIPYLLPHYLFTHPV